MTPDFTMRPKPAGSAEADGQRVIRIANWRPYRKNTLQAFFSATMPSGLVFHELMLHENNTSRWVSFPAREWKNAAGEKQYARFIDFRDRESSNRFKETMLAAIDEFLRTEGGEV